MKERLSARVRIDYRGPFEGTENFVIAIRVVEFRDQFDRVSRTEFRYQLFHSNTRRDLVRVDNSHGTPHLHVGSVARSLGPVDGREALITFLAHANSYVMEGDYE